VLAVAAAVALLAGVVALLLRAGGGGEATATSTTATTAATTTTTEPATTTTTAPYAPVEQRTTVVSAWSPGGLDPGFVAAVPALPGVLASTVVQGDRLMLTTGAPAGLAFPLDALAIDPSTYPQFVAADVQEPLARLRPGEAVLGATSAALRGATIGSTLVLLDGSVLTVSAVLPDDAVAGAEVVVAQGSLPAVHTPRYVLVAYEGDVQPVGAALRDAYPSDKPLRVRQPGESQYLRHGDGVLTDAQVKSRFGELAFAEGPTRDFAAADTAWIDAHIGSLRMPIVGTVECNREILPDLLAALEDVDRLQAELVTAAEASTTTIDPTVVPPPIDPPLLAPDANLGCFNPRLINPGAGVSRHAYGVAIDLAAPPGLGEHDERLVEIFEAHHFVWGGDFLTPDPIHFEWVG
jgi:hypothetical protein